MLQPLAPADSTRTQSNTNLSTALALSIFDRDGKKISLTTTFDHPIELIILRDPNILLPPMTLQAITSLNRTTAHHQLFNLHFVNITHSQSNHQLTPSIHLEMRTLNTSLGYSLIYRFDTAPQLNSSIKQIDGWSLFCPSSQSSFYYPFHQSFFLI